MVNICSLMPNIYDLIPYGYEKIRTHEYDAIINNYLANFTKSNNPTFTQVGGIPGAGKTTFCSNIKNNVFLSFDAIMEKIPAYQQDLYLLGNAEAFKKWEIPARIIGYEILAKAINSHCNIVLEHSGVNEAHIQLFENLRKIGYQTNMYFILCELPLALERAKEREKITHRHTPPDMIKKRFSLVNEYVSRYKGIACNTFIYDTSHDDFILQNKFCA